MYDPFEVLAIESESNWPREVSPNCVYSQALNSFDPDHPEPLIGLLTSNSPLVVSRGLYIFSEVGKRPIDAIDAALQSVASERLADRLHLMSGVIFCCRELRPYQLQTLFPLIEDSNSVVRSDMIVLLGRVPLTVLRNAVYMNGKADSDSLYVKALIEAKIPSLETQHLFDSAIESETVLGAFQLAAILRAASNVDEIVAPTYKGESQFGHDVLRHIHRFIAMRQRRH